MLSRSIQRLQTVRQYNVQVCVCVCPGSVTFTFHVRAPSWLVSTGFLEFVYSYCRGESICARYTTTWWVSHASYWPPCCHLEAQIELCTVLSMCTVQPIVTIELRNLHVKCAMCLVGFARFDQQLYSYGSLTDWLLSVTCTSYFVRIPERTHCVFTPRHVSGRSSVYWCTSALSCLRDMMSILWSLFSAWRQPTLFYPLNLKT
jgi:Pyruvate/2-oxoacid:ferredoxin oxidoreductase delta subunit